MKNKKGINLDHESKRKLAGDSVEQVKALKEKVQCLIDLAEANARIAKRRGRLEHYAFIIVALLISVGVVIKLIY